MLSSTSLAVLASLASAYVQARPIPQSVTMFRRAIMDVGAGTLTVPNIDTPASYAPKALEPYDQFHFRYTAIGCDDVDKGAPFFNECCAPRSKAKLDDSNYPVACNLPAYLIYNPVYYSDKVVAQLGREGDASVEPSSSSESSSTHESKASSESTSTSVWVPTSSSSSTWSEPSSSLTSSSTPVESTTSKSAESSSSSWTPEVKAPVRNAAGKAWSSESSTWSSSRPAWTPSSSSTPAWTPSTSSQWTPSTTAPAWTPEPTTQAAPSTSAYVAPAPQSDVFSGGQATYFYQNNVAGACGQVHSDYDKIVAIQKEKYGWTGVASPHCGQTVTITNTNTGATVVATVADACPSCQGNPNSLDLSVGAFQALGDLSLGMIPITWHFN